MSVLFETLKNTCLCENQKTRVCVKIKKHVFV